MTRIYTQLVRWLPGLAALALLVGLMTVAPPAEAGQVLLRSAGAEDAPSASAPRTQRTGTNHKYVTVDFVGTGAETCTVFHWQPFTDYANGAEMVMDFEFMTPGTSFNNTIFRVDMACVQAVTSNGCTGAGTPRACCTGTNAGNCHNYDTITLSPGTAQTIGFVASANAVHATTISATNAFDETGCTSNTPVVMKVCRDPANVTDTNTDTIYLLSARPRW
jgi:hypothetical protein